MRGRAGYTLTSGMAFFRKLAASVLGAAGLFAAQAPLPAPQTTIVGVKLLKSSPEPAATPPQILLPKSCAACEVMKSGFYEGDNPREAFFYVRVPISGPVNGVQVALGNLRLKAIVVEKNYIPFLLKDGVATFDLPVVPRARSSTVELQTSLSWPGITLRVEHADEARRAGKYATGRWPALERAVALNLEFGMREALILLGIDRKLVDGSLGVIHLMGFDTNDPLGHEDYPPHIHLILRWPHYAGSQAPHFYINADGLLGKTAITVDGMPFIAPSDVEPATVVPVVDFLGETIFENYITLEGGLALRSTDGQSCLLQPIEQAKNGFADGVFVGCSAGAKRTVRATDDAVRGELRASIGTGAETRHETYRYDPDTAVLKSAEPPLPPVSALAEANTEEVAKLRDRVRHDASALQDYGNLARYEKEDAALLVAGTSVPAAFMGDSITDYWGKRNGVFFSGKGFVNRGIGGQTTAQMLLRFRQDVIALKPKVVVILGGTNDLRLGATNEQIEDNLMSMAELARDAGIRVVLASLTPVCDCFAMRTDVRPRARLLALDNWIRRYSAQSGFGHIDYDAVLRDEQGLMRKEYTFDGVHPNDAGYGVMVPLALAAIEKALNAPAPPPTVGK